MSEKKINVPEGMLQAVSDAYSKLRYHEHFVLTERMRLALCEAALNWQSNRSPNISPELLEKLATDSNVSKEAAYDIVDIALRRMYLAPEPEAPVDEEKERFRVALEKLARLGNGNQYGNSDGNVIAQDALRGDKPEPHEEIFWGAENPKDGPVKAYAWKEPKLLESIDTPFGRIEIDDRVPPGEIRLNHWNGPILVKNISTEQNLPE